MTATDELWDLRNLRAARGLGDWMFDQFRAHVRGSVVEIGAGIGTFSERLLRCPIDDLLLIEPEPACADDLRALATTDPRVTVATETLPESPALRGRAGRVDFLLCQNVLEHIADDTGAVRAMSDALVPGSGVLTLLVPAHPRLYGALDRAYGHERRYTRGRLEMLAASADLDVLALYAFNALGVLGWVVKNRQRRPQLDTRSLKVYERLLPFYRRFEDARRPPAGLSLILHARRRAPSG